MLEKEIEKRYNIDKIKEDWGKVSNFEGLFKINIK